MKKVLVEALKWATLPLFLALVYIDSVGLVFAASMIAAAVAGWGFDVEWAFAYLAVAWKVYAGLGVFTFAFLTTFSFQHCCAGVQSFRSHLKHAGWVNTGGNLLGAIIWPWSWFNLGRNLAGWGMSLPDAMINAVMYWLVDSWRGVSFTVWNVETDEQTTIHVKTPEDAQRAMTDALTKGTPK
jgi:hypothetical protein